MDSVARVNFQTSPPGRSSFLLTFFKYFGPTPSSVEGLCSTTGLLLAVLGEPERSIVGNVAYWESCIGLALNFHELFTSDGFV